MLPRSSMIHEPPPKTVPSPLSPVILQDATNNVLSYALAGRILFHVFLLRSPERPDAWGMRTRSAPSIAYFAVICGKCDSQQVCMPMFALDVLMTGNDEPGRNASCSLSPRCVFRYVPHIFPFSAMR